jgi:xylulokinase
MLCYKNGALAREQVRDRCAKGDWHTFNEMVEQSPPGCRGRMGFFFPLPEIIPQNVVGNYFFETTGLMATGTPLPVDDIPGSLHPRAILESQLLSIRSRVERLLPKDSPHLRRLVLSGGGSANQVIRQVAAVSNQTR